jgi:hypothetical protein
MGRPRVVSQPPNHFPRLAASLKLRHSRSLTGVVEGSKTAAKLRSQEPPLPGQARGLKAPEETAMRTLLSLASWLRR